MKTIRNRNRLIIWTSRCWIIS